MPPIRPGKFKEKSLGGRPRPGVLEGETDFVHLGADSIHREEMSFAGKGAKARAINAAKFYSALRDRGIFHPRAAFAVYKKGDRHAVLAVTPRMERPADPKQAREKTSLVRELAREWGLPKLNWDYSPEREGHHLEHNFRSDGSGTYLVDYGLFTPRHGGKPAQHPGVAPNAAALRKIAGKAFKK